MPDVAKIDPIEGTRFTVTWLKAMRTLEDEIAFMESTDCLRPTVVGLHKAIESALWELKIANVYGLPFDLAGTHRLLQDKADALHNQAWQGGYRRGYCPLCHWGPPPVADIS